MTLNNENSLLKERVKALEDSYFLKDNQLTLTLQELKQYQEGKETSFSDLKKTSDQVEAMNKEIFSLREVERTLKQEFSAAE